MNNEKRYATEGKTITVRLSKDEHSIFMMIAARSGMYPAQYLRTLVDSVLEKEMSRDKPK